MDARTKPAFPWQLPLLGGISALGLYAMFRAGEAAFSLLERGHTYSLTMALFIEAASVVVALEIALSYKEEDEGDSISISLNWPAVVVEIITLTCSAIFNYTWVARVLTDESVIQIIAYSVGPLVALSGIGLTTGNVLRKWLTAVEEWKESMASQAQAEEADGVAHQNSLATQELQAKLQLQADAQAAEIVERTRKAKVQERIQRKELKLQAEASAALLRKEPVAVAALPVVTAELPEWMSEVPRNKAEFVAMVNEGSVKLPVGLTGKELAGIVPALNTDRSARLWIEATKPVPNDNGHH